MPFQNRVDPFGQIHAVSARGEFTGNRGVIHDPATRTLLKRRWSTKAWIICVCDFRGRRRDVMGRNAASGNAGWTELFFLDEVTALAAGHRPCFYCQRERALAFSAAFGRAFGIAQPRIGEIDARLHRERLASGGTPVTLTADPCADADLPDGMMLARGSTPYAIRNGMLLPWSFDGYGAPARIFSAPLTEPRAAAAAREGRRPPTPRQSPALAPTSPEAPKSNPASAFAIVTPPTTLAVLKAGYQPRFATSQT